MSFDGKIVLNPIGYVKTSAVGDEVKDKSAISQIVLREELVEGLIGITGFSQVVSAFLPKPNIRRAAQDFEGSSLEADRICL